jgi:Fe-S-cluster containining protein
MLLSEADIERLENAGCARKDFVSITGDGFAQLRNKHGHCVFYDSKKSRCLVYRKRPLGCRIYPVILSEEEGIIVDELCPMKDTVSTDEAERKGKVLVRLLRRIDEEARRRRSASRKHGVLHEGFEQS